MSVFQSQKKGSSFVSLNQLSVMVNDKLVLLLLWNIIIIT